MKTKITAFIIIVLTLFSVCCTGCSSPSLDEQSDALVIIVGRHANAKFDVSEVSDSILELISRSIAIHGDPDNGYKYTVNVKFIVSDGEPEVIEINWENRLGYDIITDYAFVEDTRREIQESIIKLLTEDSLKANDEEVDLQKAVSLAATLFEQNVTGDKDSTNKHLVIIDSGIVTVGFLNMNQFDFESDSVATLYDNIPEERACPTLTGVDVHMIGIGNVAGQQKNYSYDQLFRNKLIDFWKVFFEKCECTITKDSFQYSSGGGVEMNIGYPKVTPVDFFGGIKVVLHDLMFEGDSADFKEGVDGEEIINNLVENKFKNRTNDYFKIYVVGSSARVVPEDNLKHEPAYAGARAIRVAEMLEKKLPNAEIIPIDAGMTTFSWRNADEFQGGTEAVEDYQAMNRVVCIISGDEAALEELQERGYIDKDGNVIDD